MSDTPPGEFEAERRSKLHRIRDLGFEPYGGPARGLTPLADLKAAYRPDMGHDGGPVVSAAGRIMLKRDMGKLSFLTLRDESGDLQVALDRKRLDDRHWQLNALLDLGDLITVTGPLGVTRKGEITIWATALAPAAKSLLPPPAKWEGLADVELRYRQRYVDLWANPPVMQLMQLRSRMVAEVRRFLADRGFLEVETPMMQPLAGGAAARPFETRHHALGIPLFLRIAPELYLKRLLVGGFTKVFELNRNFRNEGMSPRHNPEFTMLEAYEAFGSWETMAQLVEDLICHLANTFFGGLRIEHRGPEGQVMRTINLARPWRRVRLAELVAERTGWHFDFQPLAAAPADVAQRIADAYADRAAPAAEAPRRQQVREGFLEHLRGLTPAEQLQEVYEKLIEPTLIDPCFVTHVPSVIIPLARESRQYPGFADVYELAINGVEISPGYSELNDPDVQERHFAHQVGDEAERHKTDHDFLTALRYGMPPAGGLGLGIDRLLMMLTGAPSIRDVILFPLMKPLE